MVQCDDDDDDDQDNDDVLLTDKRIIIAICDNFESCPCNIFFIENFQHSLQHNHEEDGHLMQMSQPDRFIP